MTTRMLLFFFFFLKFFGISFTQESEKRIEETFLQRRDALLLILQKEIQEIPRLNGSKPDLFSSTIPEKLPDWFFKEDDPCDDIVYLYGISDPGMEEELGYRIAKTRMGIICSLLSGTRVKSLRDQYTVESENRLIEYFLTYAHFQTVNDTICPDLKILGTHITQYEETILFGYFDKKKIEYTQGNLFFGSNIAEAFTQSRGYGNSNETNERIKLTTSLTPRESPDQITALSYDSYSINKITNSFTILDGDTISSLPALNLKYLSSGLNPDIHSTKNLPGFSLRNGLWFAYLSAVLFELSEKAFDDTIHVSNVTDSHSGALKNLIRESAISPVRLDPKSLFIDFNDLYILFH